MRCRLGELTFCELLPNMAAPLFASDNRGALPSHIYSLLSELMAH